MNSIISLNENYSTTKLCYELLDDKYLTENGKIKDDLKFKINIPEFEIVDSKIPAKKDEKFDTYLFLPEREGRKGEGGLRTKGLFKCSYKLVKSEQLIVNSEKKHTYDSQFTSHDSQFTNHNSPITDLSPIPYPISHNHLPLITIITVVYNGEKYLEETIQSVINQTYPNVEYIIIDGGSTDGTLDIIKKYEDSIDYWVSEKDNGIYDAMNKGLRAALGDYVAILNSDDFYEPDAVKKSISCILDKGSDYSIANVKFAENQTKIKPIYPLKEGKIYQEMPYPHVSAFISSKIYKDIGLFDTDFKIAGDHDSAIRIHLKGYHACYLDEVIANLHIGGISSGFVSSYESTKVAIKNGKNIFLAYAAYFAQVAKLFIAKKLPAGILKKIQNIKGSRFGD